MKNISSFFAKAVVLALIVVIVLYVGKKVETGRSAANSQTTPTHYRITWVSDQVAAIAVDRDYSCNSPQEVPSILAQALNSLPKNRIKSVWPTLNGGDTTGFVVQLEADAIADIGTGPLIF